MLIKTVRISYEYELRSDNEALFPEMVKEILKGNNSEVGGVKKMPDNTWASYGYKIKGKGKLESKLWQN